MSGEETCKTAEPGYIPAHPLTNLTHGKDGTLFFSTFGGCTLRDLFAIEAPPQPYWFEPVMETERPNGGTTEEIQAWERECAIHATAQWPWAYADLVLSARKGGAT